MAVASAFSLAVCLPPAAAQTRKPAVGSAPPQPVPITVKTARSATAEIPLRIFGRRHQTLSFLVRTPPRAGKVTVPESSGAESAIMRYTPPADRKITRETFFYAVRSADGVSAPAEVTVEILDTPAELITPGELRFGAVLLGASETREIEVRNRGGDLAEGIVEADPPWRIDSGERYRLQPEGRAFIRVTFAPTAAGAQTGELRYSSQPDRATSLMGEARAPLELRPEKLKLAFEALTGERSGLFEVVNHTDAEQTIVLHADERVHVERTLKLPPGARAAVNIATRADDVAAFEGTVRLEAGKHCAVLAVIASAAPAAVRMSATSLFLRPDIATAQSRAELVLENRGGTATDVAVQATSPFKVSASTIALPPGGKQSLAVFLPGQLKEQPRGTLGLSGDGIARTVELRTEHPGPLFVAQPAGSPVRPARRTEEPRPAAPEIDSTLAEVMARSRTRVINLSPRSVTLEWDGTFAPGRYRGQIRNLALRDHELEVTWPAHSGFKAEGSGGKVRGIFSALEPGRVHALRVVAMQDDGASDVLVAAASIATPALPKKASFLTWRRALVAAALALVGYVALQRWRARHTGF